MFPANFFKKNAGAILVVVLTCLTHAINLFGYPEFIGDEGIYTSQGWWLVKFGQLSPYTYWYDHPPFGWLQIGLWQALTGGPFTFGFSLHSTRILMVIVAALTNLLLFLILKKLTKSKKWAFLGSLIFAFSPLAITYHRQVLLDNLATFWLLLSFYLLLQAKKRLPFFALSGLSLGLSFLSKEIAILFFPSFLMIAFWQGRGKTQLFLLASFLISALFLMALYPLLAYLKIELLPASWFPGQRQHVSLLEAVFFQGGRGGGGGLFSPQSDIRQAILSWLNYDKILPVLGLWATFLLLLEAKNLLFLALFLASFIFTFFLARGGVVLGFYLIPQIALWAITIPLALKIVSQRLKINFSPRLSLSLLVIFIFLLAGQNLGIYFLKQTQPQKEALAFIRQNVPPEAVLATDPFCWLDLKLDEHEATFPKAEWFYKIENDPQIREGKLGGKWQKIDYLFISKEFQSELEKSRLPFLEQAFKESQLVKRFNPPIDPYEFSLYKLKDEAKLSPFGKIIKETQKEPELAEKIRSLIISPKESFGGFLVTGPESLAKISSDQLVFVDQEGGEVSRLTESPNPSQAAIVDENEAFRVAKARGTMLLRHQIDVNLAPVLEIAYSPQSFIARGGRSFGADKERVVNLGQAMIKGFSEAGIKTVAKHFPGSLGRTTVDPHQTLPVINISAEELEKDWAPFAEVDPQPDGILVTHLLYPQIDPKFPSSLSPIFINAILRQRLDFRGLVILDDLDMKAISKSYSQSEAVKLGLLAGAEMFIIQNPKEGLAEEIASLAQNDEILAGLVNRAWGKVQDFTLGR